MGAGGSVDSGCVFNLSGSSDDIAIEGDALLHLDISTVTREKFHTMECRVGREQTFLDEAMNVAIVRGCTWKHSEIPNSNFADKWFDKAMHITPETLQAINEIAMESNLYSNFREQYIQPDNIPNGLIFIDINFQLRANGSRCITKLTGCVPRSDLSRSWEDTEAAESLSSMWLNRIQQLFPGDIPKEERTAFKRWWREVDMKFERAVTAALQGNVRADFASHLAKQTAAYRRYVNSQDEHYMEESQHWRTEAHAAAHRIIGAVVDSFYAVGEQLLLSGNVSPAVIEKTTQKLRAVKKSLQAEFETDIFDLANQLQDSELACWKALEARFNRGSFDKEGEDDGDTVVVYGDAPDTIKAATRGSFDTLDMHDKLSAESVRQLPKSSTAASQKKFDFSDTDIAAPSQLPGMLKRSGTDRSSLSSVKTTPPRIMTSYSSDCIGTNLTTPLGGVLSTASKRSSMSRLSKILEVHRTQLNRRQDSHFITSARFSFEQVLFEMVSAEKMRECLDRAKSSLEEKWRARHDREVAQLRQNQSKERAAAVNNNATTADLEAMREKHWLEVEGATKEFIDFVSKQRADFERGSRRTHSEMQERIASFRDSSRAAALSNVSADKFKAICAIYERLRA
jgi:hypothetical protein